MNKRTTVSLESSEKVIAWDDMLQFKVLPFEMPNVKKYTLEHNIHLLLPSVKPIVIRKSFLESSLHGTVVSQHPPGKN